MSSNCPESDASDTAVAPSNQWSSVSKHVVNSYVEANNALLAAMGFSPSRSSEPNGESSGTTDESVTPVQQPETAEAPVSEVAFGDETWFMERSTDSCDDLAVGDYVRFTKPIEDADVSAFAQVSGDTNRLHTTVETADGDTVIDGEAIVIIEPRSDA